MQLIKPFTTALTDGSFSRASSATYTKKDGTLGTASINIPRFQYDYKNSVSLGALIEPAATNNCFFSEDISSGFWTKTNSTVTVNATLAPDGVSVTADKWIENTSLNVNHQLRSDFTPSINDKVWFSIYVKPAGRNLIGMYTGGGSVYPGGILWIDINTLQVNNPGGLIEYSIEKLANGWVRISRANTWLTSNDVAQCYMLMGTGSITSPVDAYTGDGSSGVYVWGGQIEKTILTSYYPNLSNSTSTRSSDVISGSGLIYTTATETYSTWSNATTYDLNTYVIYNSRIYQSLQASNLNHQPDTSSTWWLDTGPDNRHAMFDGQVSTSTTATTNLTVVFTSGAIDSLALINVVSDTVSITVKDSTYGNIIYSQTAGLSGVGVSDWYQYFFFDPLLKRTQIIFKNISPFNGAIVTLEFNVVSGQPISCGACVFGSLSNIGDTQFGATASIIDFSTKDTDSFGNTTFVKRNYSKRMSTEVFVDNSQLNRIYALFAAIRATPVVWIGSDDPTFQEPLIVYGFYRDFSINISYPQNSMCSIEVEGLT